MLARLKGSLTEIPEHRSGKNKTYELADAGLAAFGIFFMQSPSFLAHQRDMQRRKGRNNADSVFGVERIHSDGQIRNRAGPSGPSTVAGILLGDICRSGERGIPEAISRGGG